MQKIFVAAILAVVMQSSASAQSADSLSTALGVLVGNDLKNMNIPNFNSTEFTNAFTTMLQGGQAKMTLEQAQSVFMKYRQKTESAKKQADAAKYEQVKAEGQAFLEKNKQRPGVITTASGLQYEVMKEGTGAKPTALTDKVRVHYHGTLIDGSVFDSSVQRGETIEFPLNGVISGWGEAVMLMSIGSKYKIYLPYNLAYGDKSPSPKIPPYSTLIFEIELFEINGQK